jgi:peptidoglycan hydrolase CwlO-like protein
MLDFNTSQLTWIVIGACSLGGTGYLTINDHVQNIDKKVEVTQTKVDDVNSKITDLKEQLSRIEDKMTPQKK